jgi:hypothetical protein
MSAHCRRLGGHYHITFYLNGNMGTLVCALHELIQLKQAMPGVAFTELTDDEPQSAA